MSKLFVFGIGGTGARVLRSLTMLLMAGVKTNNNIDEIIPIVIEKDSTNGDMARTTRIINNYIDTRAKYAAGTDKFFSTRMSYLSDEKNLQMTLTDNNEEFSKYIGFDQLTDSTKAFVEILFSKESLEMKTTEGFRGVPSIGSVVLNQFENSEFFNTFARRFDNGDKIFIISSIFGGTGASGFPLLVKTLRGQSDRQGWDYVNNAPIGAISVLPYFNVERNNDLNVVNVDSGTFNSKAKAALAYYERTLGNGMVNHMYFVGDKKMSTYKYCSGGGGQINPAHFVEVVSALSIIDFINRDNANAEGTSYHEFGLYEPREGQDPCEIRFGDLGSNTLDVIREPLIQFYAFKQYMDLVFNKEYRHQPWAHNYPWNSDKNFGEDEKNQLTACFLDFKTWLEELDGKMDGYKDSVPGHHRFSPFNLESKSIAFVKTEYVNSEDDVIAVNNNRYKDWAWFDNELNRHKKGSSSLETKQRFMDIFYKATEKFAKLIPAPQPQEGGRKFEVLTLREEDAIAQGDWQNLQNSPYGEEQLMSISESNSTSTTEPTSIPSPFARMEVARTAFKNVTEILKKEIKDGNRTRTAEWRDVPCRYQKTVSDCLDVAEIFFNYEQCKDFVEIIKWNVGYLDEIEENLEKNPNNDLLMRNAELVRVMKKFIDADNSIYNFDRMNSIYLLNYIGDNRPKKKSVNIIGATSPVTMFFSVGNDLRYVNEKIKFRGLHNPFDGIYTPLEKRDPNFIKYLSNYIGEYNRAYPDIENKFAADFTVLNEYLEVALNRVPNNININDVINDWKKISVGQNNNEHVSVLGQLIYTYEQKLECSDFYISSSMVVKGEKRPLVLPVNRGNDYKNYKYVSEYDKWGETREAPRCNKIDLNKRILPDTNIKHPYLTISDFLEDEIIKMPFELNDKNFFNGNCEGDKNVSFLLPFTPTFFKYFSVDDLMTKKIKIDGKDESMIKMQVSDSVVKVTLRIPIESCVESYNNDGNLEYKSVDRKLKYKCVEYNKTYQTQADGYNGGTIEVKFGMGIFPIIRPINVDVAHYRVALFAKDREDMNLTFYDNSEIVKEQHSKVRREVRRDVCGIKTYVIEKSKFDRIKVSVKINNCDKCGYIIPKFVDISTNETQKRFKFAVDFGTTNTHIAYSIDEGSEEAFVFDCKNPQIVRLHKDYGQHKAIGVAFDDNFVPTNDGRFPMRSAFAEAVDINYKYDKYTICDGNIPFVFEKVGPRDYQRIWTGDDLKWSANEDRIKLYIKNLAFIIHNKVLCGKGRLEETEIRWFYPASMPIGMRSDMNDAWNDAYKDFFGENYSNNVISMSESIAPYCYFMNRDGALGRVVTIDIGGGTTDVYISDGQEGNDGYMFSFRCASDAIFGDGYNNNIRNNGFVRKYKNILGEVTSVENSENLEGNMGGTLAEALKNVVKSSELIPFFFSSDNTFLDRLSRDNEFKYVFLIFYSAIIYHVAQTMIAKGIGKPKTVVFSGNGSRTLKVIARGVDIQSDFVKSIFEKVYEEEYNDGEFVFKYDDNPKEATAKGGLNAEDYQIKAKPKSIVLLGIDNETFVKLNNQVDDKNEKMAENVCYDALTREIKKKVVDNVCRFIEFVPKLNTCNAFGEKYLLDVNILKDVLDICKQNLGDYFDLGVQRALDMLSSDTYRTKDVTESLFFFPIVGMLNNLAQKLYEKYNNNAS